MFFVDNLGITFVDVQTDSSQYWPIFITSHVLSPLLGATCACLFTGFLCGTEQGGANDEFLLHQSTRNDKKLPWPIGSHLKAQHTFPPAMKLRAFHSPASGQRQLSFSRHEFLLPERGLGEQDTEQPSSH